MDGHDYKWFLLVYEGAPSWGEELANAGTLATITSTLVGQAVLDLLGRPLAARFSSGWGLQVIWEVDEEAVRLLRAALRAYMANKRRMTGRTARLLAEALRRRDPSILAALSL